MFFAKDTPSQTSSLSPSVCIAGLSDLGLFLAYTLQKKGCDVTILDSPSRLSEFENADIIVKEPRLLQNQRCSFKYAFEMEREPDILIIASLLRNTAVPLLTPSKLKNTLVLNFSFFFDSQNLKDILKTPVIDACFTAYLHRDKNHLSVLGADSLLYAGVDETDGRAFKIKSLFEDTKIKVSVSENQRLNFWRFFAPFIISNLLSAARGKNFYALYKNDEERKIIDLCAEETVALAAEENVRLEHAEILVSLYNIPSGYVSPLQNASSPKTADILSSLLGSPGKNRRAQAPTLYALLREIYNKY